MDVSPGYAEPMTNPANDLPRIRRMLSAQGGRATITISSPRGAHATFKIKHKDKGNSAGRTFVDIPDESAEYGWRGVGEVIDHGPDPLRWPPFDGGVETGRLSFRAWRNTSRELAYAVRLVLAALAREGEPDYLATVRGGPYGIQAADSCGCCGRQLTHPDSIPVGIGPECAAKNNLFHPGYSSQHVRRTA
jgi:hypothetical protein